MTGIPFLLLLFMLLDGMLLLLTLENVVNGFFVIIGRIFHLILLQATNSVYSGVRIVSLMADKSFFMTPLLLVLVCVVLLWSVLPGGDAVLKIVLLDLTHLILEVLLMAGELLVIIRSHAIYAEDGRDGCWYN